jgi:hypothetical protein
MPLNRIIADSITDGTIVAADIADGTITNAKIVSVANTKITGNIISSQITSVANTQLTGNIISSQITSVANTQLTGTITGSQISSNTLSNTVFQTGSVENYMNAAGLGFGMRNRIINGAMVIDQRKAGANATVTSSDYFSCDRWQQWASVTSKYSVEQTISGTAAPTGFTDYLGATSLSAYSVLSADNFSLYQAIEGFNTADLGWGAAGASTVTLSFWVRSSLTGTFGGALSNSAVSRSYPFSYTISSANTWEQKTVTIAGDTSGTWIGATNGIGIRLWFSLGAGSTYLGTAGAWAGADYRGATGQTSVVGTNGATFYITGVQLEKGSTATSFDYRPYGTELALCQRYYYLVASGASGQIGTGYYYSTTQTQLQVKFAVSMRTAPVLSSVTGTGYYKIEPVGGAVDGFNSFTIYLPNTEGAMIYNSTEISGTANYSGQVYTNNAAAFVAFSAEL